MKVLVTGGTGFVGKNLKQYMPEWIYVGSSDYDLRERDQCRKMFRDHSPDAVLHLAAKVGGIKVNVDYPASFLQENCLLNLNVVEEAYLAGVTRLLGANSTCAFPSNINIYPFTEEELFNGPPPYTNLAYGFAKRLLHVQCASYTKQYGVNYSTFSPSNLYGPGDNFDLESSHFVPSLIKKIVEANDGDTIEFWGTGTTLKQELYVKDLCHILPILLEKHYSEDSIIVAPDENLSILDMINTLIEYTGKNINITFNGFLDGQYRKDGSNKKLKELIPDIKFTSFAEGVKKTYESYKDV